MQRLTLKAVLSNDGTLFLKSASHSYVILYPNYPCSRIGGGLTGTPSLDSQVWELFRILK